MIFFNMNLCSVAILIYKTENSLNPLIARAGFPIPTKGVKTLLLNVLLYGMDCPVHSLDMLKPVITFVFKVLRNGLLRYILYTCPNL